MAVSIIGPKFYAWDSDTGKPLAFGKVYTYQAGTNTPKATFQSEDAVTENTNPVVLNGAGYADIYLIGSYKIVVKDADDVDVWTADPVTDASGIQKEWVNERAATQVSPTSFTLVGNYTDVYQAGKAVKMDDATIIYGRIESVQYLSGNTVVEVTADSSLTSDLSRAWVSLLTDNGLPNSINERVIRVTSIAAIEAYSVPAGYVFSLNAGGRSGTFDVLAGDFSTELAADTLNGVYVGLADDPTATTKVVKRRYQTGLSPNWFGAANDGVTDDILACQAMANLSEKTLDTLSFPAGFFYITSPILLPPALGSIQISGVSCGDAYIARGQATGQTTVIRTLACNAFVWDLGYPSSGISIEKIKHEDFSMSGTPSKSGYLLRIVSTRQVKAVWITECTSTGTGGLFNMYSSNNVNAPYVTMTRCYTWATDKVVFLENVPTTIFTINDSLFHGTADYAIHASIGGEFSLVNTWFESCSPAPLYNPTSNFFKVAMHNVFFENRSAETNPSYSTIWEAGPNSTFVMTGKTNFAFLTDNSSLLGPNSVLYNYTDTNVQIESNGGIIMTPERVSLHKGRGFKHIALIPFREIKNLDGNTNIDLMSKNIGGSDLAIANEESEIPTQIKEKYAGSNRILSGDVGITDAYLDDRLLCCSFIYASGDGNLGFDASVRKLVVDGVTINFSNAFGIFPTREGEPMICVAAIDLPAGSVASLASISMIGVEYQTMGSLFAAQQTTLSSLLPFEGRVKRQTKVIPAGGSDSFILTGTYTAGYKLDAEFEVDYGKGGTYKIESNGTVANFNKNVYVTDRVTNLDVVFTDNSTSAHINYLAINVANNGVEDVEVSFRWTY